MSSTGALTDIFRCTLPTMRGTHRLKRYGPRAYPVVRKPSSIVDSTSLHIDSTIPADDMSDIEEPMFDNADAQAHDGVQTRKTPSVCANPGRQLLSKIPSGLWRGRVSSACGQGAPASLKTPSTQEEPLPPRKRPRASACSATAQYPQELLEQLRFLASFWTPRARVH